MTPKDVVYELYYSAVREVRDEVMQYITQNISF